MLRLLHHKKLMQFLNLIIDKMIDIKFQSKIKCRIAIHIICSTLKYKQYNYYNDSTSDLIINAEPYNKLNTYVSYFSPIFYFFLFFFLYLQIV